MGSTKAKEQYLKIAGSSYPGDSDGLKDENNFLKSLHYLFRCCYTGLMMLVDHS